MVLLLASMNLSATWARILEKESTVGPDIFHTIMSPASTAVIATNVSSAKVSASPRTSPPSVSISGEKASTVNFKLDEWPTATVSLL